MPCPAPSCLRWPSCCIWQVREVRQSGPAYRYSIVQEQRWLAGMQGPVVPHLLRVSASLKQTPYPIGCNRGCRKGGSPAGSRSCGAGARACFPVLLFLLFYFFFSYLPAAGAMGERREGDRWRHAPSNPSHCGPLLPSEYGSTKYEERTTHEGAPQPGWACKGQHCSVLLYNVPSANATSTGAERTKCEVEAGEAKAWEGTTVVGASCLRCAP